MRRYGKITDCGVSPLCRLFRLFKLIADIYKIGFAEICIKRFVAVLVVNQNTAAEIVVVNLLDRAVIAQIYIIADRRLQVYPRMCAPVVKVL